MWTSIAPAGVLSPPAKSAIAVPCRAALTECRNFLADDRQPAQSRRVTIDFNRKMRNERAAPKPPGARARKAAEAAAKMGSSRF
jgi:hypothetical protein